MNGGPTPLPAAFSESVVAVLRAPDAGLFAAVAETLADAGVPAVEVTLTSPGAIEAIEAIRDRLGSRVALGVGSVGHAAAARAAIDAGAAYVVSAGLVPEVLEQAVARGVPTVPGAMTPTEVLAAWHGRASAVKLFPADTLGGAAYLRQLRGPLPDIPLVPTGGVGLDDVRPLIEAGALTVGVGGSLLGDVFGGGSLRDLERRARAFAAAAREARSAREARA